MIPIRMIGRNYNLIGWVPVAILADSPFSYRDQQGLHSYSYRVISSCWIAIVLLLAAIKVLLLDRCWLLAISISLLFDWFLHDYRFTLRFRSLSHWN